MTAIDPDHRALMQEGRRWFFYQVGDLVEGVTKAEILPHFRSLLKKEGDRAATDLINKVYSKQPVKLAHSRDILASINAVLTAHGRSNYSQEDVLIAAYFWIDGLCGMLKDLNLDAVHFPKEQGITTELIEDLMAGARTTLFSALLVMRIINRLRHEKKAGWIDPRKRILTDVRRGKEKLKVVTAASSLVERAPYDFWMPHKGKPLDLQPEDRHLRGQAISTDSADAGDGTVVTLHQN